MSANEFGNYIAGYAGVYHLGYGGWIGMRLAGNFYANQGRFWEREDEESIRDIDSGAGDAWGDRLEDDIRRNLP
ncbi:hypothetical protein STSP2_02353 [Anaerohalosphaera lusitana]|uniref:Uncharacterized protein n=1 Tax=Anaerohalosphaera lusitana TaxID=1936003 RepID=A0A1U9NNS9_9BACT|nr:hypothetical protein [Anaerohalosphaera lusitana]AQT69166.1 hypothetical protein STSP2_02353 [Anaerohalosphaera lusitana]